MYTLLRSIVPQRWCDWFVACWFALLIILIFVLWDGNSADFHYLQM